MEDYVTYEQAKKLKELGFDWKTHAFYLGTTLVNDISDYKITNSTDLPIISAPTLTQAQKWFLEENKIYIEIYSTNYLTNFGYELKFDYEPIKRYCAQAFLNPNEALSSGIDDAINYIEENG
ncbi:MAG: hypothetical protein J1F35_08405 [Erysipelotrichales bacterium]|nr:hypothetical protein [Erysipelotrichales bacterium]